MPNHTRQCIVCNQKYDYCKACPSSKNEPTWRAIYDTEECKKVFEICSAYINKHMSKGDAVIKLKSFNLPSRLNDHYKKIVDEIMHIDKPAIKRKRTRGFVQKEVVNDDY